MRAAGSWSLMPTQEVSNSPISPSGDTEPKRQPTAPSKASFTASRPANPATTLSFR